MAKKLTLQIPDGFYFGLTNEATTDHPAVLCAHIKTAIHLYLIYRQKQREGFCCKFYKKVGNREILTELDIAPYTKKEKEALQRKEIQRYDYSYIKEEKADK